MPECFEDLGQNAIFTERARKAQKKNEFYAFIRGPATMIFLEKWFSLHMRG